MKFERLDPRLRILDLALGLLRRPVDSGVAFLSALYGAVCHIVFTLAVAAMIVGMFFGMTLGRGTVSEPWFWLTNTVLIIQFPLMHSALLSRRGRSVLSRLAPAEHGRILATTTYAIVASLQLVALFVLWTPSGVIWWQAEGWAFWALTGLYAASWGLLIKASFDAGAEVQSGALGWMSLYQNIRVRFPDMPQRGLFRLIRQPIYVAFALTLWTVPVWTPDQLLLAVLLTLYCLLGPLLKERRFEAMFGARFDAYRATTPYALPRWPRRAWAPDKKTR